MKKKLLAGLAVGLMVFCITETADANLIVNGGFEQPVVTSQPYWETPNDGYVTFEGGIILTGWNYNELIHFDTRYQPVSEGSQAIQFYSTGDWISQSFATVIGENYLLSFDLSAYNHSGGNMASPYCADCQSFLDVSVGSETALFSGLSGGYTTNTLMFTADSTNTTLTFARHGISSGYNYPHLDNVSVELVPDNPPTPTPEPATMLLMGTGLAGLIGARRKKKA